MILFADCCNTSQYNFFCGNQYARNSEAWFFYCKTIDLLLLKVEKVQVNQGIIARIFNYGSVVFFGASGKIDVFAGATEPLKLRDIILRVILNESR
ncbi:PH domain-containing protein [Aeromonas veronii]|uniref:PH domain-containing protein n=1 Tax=Aeromonas veronii TaxID=654 RepID=UPI003D190AD9